MSGFRTMLTCLALAATVGVALAPVAAQADGWRDRGYDRGYERHERWEHRGPRYYPAPVYYPAPRVYYAPPPVYYAPPPPPVYYAPPVGISLGFHFR